MKDDHDRSKIQFFSASDLEGRLARSREREKAQDIIDSAHATMKKKSQEAEREAIRRRDMMQSAAKRELSKEMDATRRKAATMAVHEILATAAKVQKKFDALTPWIEDLVETSVRRIIGTLPDAEVLKRITTQAISQNQRGLKYVLRAGADVYESCLHMVEDLEATPLRGLIIDVEVDRNLDGTSVILTSSDGALDISLETQFAAIRHELSVVLGSVNDDG